MYRPKNVRRALRISSRATAVSVTTAFALWRGFRLRLEAASRILALVLRAWFDPSLAPASWAVAVRATRRQVLHGNLSCCYQTLAVSFDQGLKKSQLQCFIITKKSPLIKNNIVLHFHTLLNNKLRSGWNNRSFSHILYFNIFQLLKASDDRTTKNFSTLLAELYVLSIPSFNNFSL